MARALRIERPGGRYHVTARGNERKSIYRDDSDRTHFLELLAESTERSALRIHVSGRSKGTGSGRKWSLLKV